MFVNPSGLTVIVEETATSMAFRNGLRRRPARVHRRVGSLRGKFYFGNWRPSAAGPGRNLGSLSLRKLRKTTSLARINSDLELDRTSGNLPTLWRAETVRGRVGLGGGDAKLFAAIGAWIGWPGLPSVLLISGFAGLTYAFLRGRGRLRPHDRIPFGPALALGGWIVWLYGPLVLS
jgi:prepilin signal peptidase PulO-like enzyme (type II secretory pathway)